MNMNPYDQTQDPGGAPGTLAPAGGRSLPPIAQVPAAQQGAGQRAFVDRIEGDPGREVAVLMTGKNGENVFNVPLMHLPKGTKEGQWIDLGTSPYDNGR